MTKPSKPLNFSREIPKLARKALKKLPKNTPAFKEAKLRTTKPMDYLRCLEFPIAYNKMEIKPGMKILDLASPQWFSLSLAKAYPDCEFTYCNIMDDEIAAIRPSAEVLNTTNIRYLKEDVRQLTFPDKSFDMVISLSAIEHVDPDVGGDVIALKEIRRVLKDAGTFFISLPFDNVRNLVYDDRHPVWERGVQKRNFYMRNYDHAQLDELARDSQFRILEKTLMFETPGLFSMHYWEGGEGKTRKEKNRVIKLKKKIDKLIGLRLEKWLAKRYMSQGTPRTPKDRPMNVVLSLAKA